MTKIQPDEQTRKAIENFVFFTFEKIETKVNDKGEEKKELIGLPPNWHSITKENYTTFTSNTDKAKGIITGIKNNITVFDFDNIEEYNKFKNKHPEVNDCFKVRTKKGYHLYFNYDPIFKTGTNVFDEYKGVDIRNDGGFVIGINTKYHALNGDKIKYTYEGGQFMNIPLYVKDYLKNIEEVKEVNKVKINKVEVDNNNNNNNNNNTMTKQEKIIDLIDVKYLDNFDSWNKIVWAMKKENYDIEYIKKISKKSSSYSEEGFKTAYNKSPKEINISQGTLNFYAKLSNENKYMQINEYDLKNLSDSTYANIIMHEISDSFIYQDGLLYVYYKNRWYEDNLDLVKYVCKSFLVKYISKILRITMDSLIDANEEIIAGLKEKIKFIQKANLNVCNVSTLDNIIKALKIELASRLDRVSFDTSLPDIICFDNVSIDLRTGEEFNVEKQHYITQHTQYNYTKSTEEQINNIKQIIDDIFPNKEDKKTYLSIMYSALTGHHLEKFTMANGGGRNGKAVINELLMTLLGEMYSYKGSITTLTKQFKEGANQEVAMMNNKRFCLFTEPNDSDPLQLGNIKTITGDAVFNARQLWSKKTKCNFLLTLIFECNKKPYINGRIDESAINRFINVPFKSYFTDDIEEMENIPDCKMQNKKYKTQEWKDEYKCALFDYLILNAPKELYVSKEIKQNTRDYLYESDSFIGWFDDNYTQSTNKDKFITVKTIYNDFKESDYYNNLQKKEKKNINEKSFKQTNILENIKLKKYFCERHKIKGKDEYSILLGFEKKVSDCFLNEEEEE